MFTYDNFIDKVNALGFISYSKVVDGFPHTEDFTADRQWWSGDPDTDPSLWAARGAAEKKLVYGGYFKGKRGCIAPDWYPVYYSAFYPGIPLEARYRDGKVTEMEWRIWQLLQTEGRLLGTHALRGMLGITPKSGASALDTALTKLVISCDLVSAGEADMIDKNGKPYNKSIAFDLVDRWIPQAWLAPANLTDPTEAREKINRQLRHISPDADEKSLGQLFDKQTRRFAAHGGLRSPLRNPPGEGDGDSA